MLLITTARAGWLQRLGRLCGSCPQTRRGRMLMYEPNKDRLFVHLQLLNFIMLFLESLYFGCLKICKVQSERKEVLQRQLVLFSSCLRCCV